MALAFLPIQLSVALRVSVMLEPALLSPSPSLPTYLGKVELSLGSAIRGVPFQERLVCQIVDHSLVARHDCTHCNLLTDGSNATASVHQQQQSLLRARIAFTSGLPPVSRCPKGFSVAR